MHSFRAKIRNRLGLNDKRVGVEFGPGAGAS